MLDKLFMGLVHYWCAKTDHDKRERAYAAQAAERKRLDYEVHIVERKLGNSERP